MNSRSALPSLRRGRFRTVRDLPGPDFPDRDRSRAGSRHGVPGVALPHDPLLRGPAGCRTPTPKFMVGSNRVGFHARRTTSSGSPSPSSNGSPAIRKPVVVADEDAAGMCENCTRHASERPCSIVGVPILERDQRDRNPHRRALLVGDRARHHRTRCPFSVHGGQAGGTDLALAAPWSPGTANA
jgi:hypothetical protein